MEVKGLRIGNYVYLIADGHEDEPDLVCWSLLDYEFYYGKMEYIEPIELTEDWLLKCGCIKQKINETLYNYWNKEFDFSVDVECFDEYNKIYHYRISNNSKKHLIYVHKLQNLYYELKDKELEINL